MRLQIYVRLTEYGDEDQPAPFFLDTSAASWKRLKHLFSDFYSDRLDQDVEVWYWDEEDLVIVSSQEELDEAFRLAEEGGRSYLQFHVQRVVRGTTRSNTQQPAADFSRGTAAVDHVRGQQFQERKGTGVQHPECSMWENSQPSELPRAEKPRSIFDNTPKQPNSLADAMDNGTEEGLDVREKAQGKRVSQSAGEAASRSLDNVRAQLLAYLQEHQVVVKACRPQNEMLLEEFEDLKESWSPAEDIQSMGPECEATLRKMMSAYPVKGLTLEQSDEDESADLGHCMLPGALSGANAIAIEMPEMEHQGTESAEPAEIAETGEVTTKSSRDAETGFWMQPLLEAEVKHDSRDNVENQALQTLQEDASRHSFSEVELRRKLNTLVEKQQASSDRLQQKKHERKASRTDSSHKKKKHREGELVLEKSVGDCVMKGKSTSTNTSSNPLDVVSEKASSSAPRPHKKHESKPSKSEDKKKKPSTELLTEDAFVRYMNKLEVLMKKDIAKAVAKKTARNVIKNLPKQGEWSEPPASTPVIPSQQTGYVHERIICDYCDRQIVGTRYICGNCPEYDLCEECESIQPSFHDSSHVFIKLRRPCSTAGTHHGIRRPLLKRVIYEAKDEERKEDGERIQEIKECAKGPESPAERCVSRNNNSEEGEEEGLSEPPSQDEQEEEYQTLENSERMYDVKASEVTDSKAETNVSVDQTMESAKSQDRTLSTVTENMTSAGADCQSTVFHATELTAHPVSRKLFPPAFGVKGIPDLNVPYNSTVPEASKVPVPDLWIEQPTELKSEAADDEEDDDLGPEDDLYPECVEDGFVVCSPTQGCSEEQVTGERSTSPASSIEVVDTHFDVCSEPVTSSQQSMTVKDETGVRIHQSTQYQADDVDSLGSFTDESSSDEDFVVIVPDCFDTSKPLDPVSLQRLSHEKLNKGSTLENKLDKDQSEWDTVVRGNRELANNLEFVRREFEARNTPRVVAEERFHFRPATEEEERSFRRPNCNVDDHKVAVDLVIYPERKTEGETTAVSEEAEAEEENSCAQEDLPSVMEASSNQLEACAAVDHTPEPSKEVKVSQSQSHSFRSSTQDTKHPDVSDIHQTDLKCPQEFEEEGAAADPDSLDPEQQLNDIVTNTFKKASSGLQQLYKTGKDIFKTLQRGDSYEPEESTYVFEPADYKLPESTWRPSNKEFVLPKSNFKLVEKEFHMPKTTYSGPQTQASPAGVYSGEFSGPLQRIREMGYFNNERTLALLRKYEGDVEKVVNELIEEADSDWADRRHGNSA